MKKIIPILIIGGVILALIFSCVGLFRDKTKDEIIMHQYTFWPIAIIIGSDMTTDRPEGLLINIDTKTCIPESCQLTPLEGQVQLITAYSEDGESKQGTPMALATQIRKYIPEPTTAMFAMPDGFEIVAIAQIDNNGMHTGPNMFVSSFGDTAEAPNNLMSWWQSLECRVVFFGNPGIPCGQTGYYPDQNLEWIAPAKMPTTSTTIQVYILKMASNGGLALFSVDSEAITVEDIKYIAQQWPDAAAMLKVYTAAESLIPAVTP